MQQLTFILFFVWTAALVLSIWAVEVARMFARRIAKARKKPGELPPNPPSLALILPIKGVEEDTADNLAALFKLNYPRLRLLFPIESEHDPVVPLLQQLIKNNPETRAEIVVAGLATTRGQKIHNQLAAVARTSPDDQVLVFMDADARPHDHWLPALVGPLVDDHVGATTGYRLYVPSNSNLASAQVSVINATIAALLGPPARNQAWGGSMAVTRKNFFELGIHDAWQNALSDDYVLTRVIKRTHKKQVHFQHSCFVASSAAFNWKSFFEFAPRQYKITRVCSPLIWLTAVAGSLLYVLAFAYPPILFVISLFAPPPARPDYLLLLMFATLYVANIFRGFFLLQGSKAALPEHAQKLQAAAFWYTFAFPLTFFTNFLALLKSSLGRTIQWRGITYTLVSPTQTTVVRNDAPAQTALPAAPAPTPELIAK